MKKQKRIKQKQLHDFARSLKESGAAEWQPIPTYAKRSDRVVDRQRNNEIPALPAQVFESRALYGIAVARVRQEFRKDK